MRAKELKKKYLDFFKKKKHSLIENSSLIPEHDPSVLFTTAGMHPLVPYLLGQQHPKGKRLVNNQRCIRTGDINEVGDSSHLTFFEMLGNWSLGDYFKKEAIEWSFEFLIKSLGFQKKQIHVTVFKGDKDADKDTESAKIWERLGITKDKIYFLPKKDNWWGPAGETGPCGPCTEMFIDTGKKKCSSKCILGCNCGKYFEIWNDVFMEYDKTEKGKYVKLKLKNVDTGMGVERTVAMLEGKKSVYDTELFYPIINHIKKIAKEYSDSKIKSLRIIADHLRASVFILGDGVVPSNVDQGYVLRRLIRRAVRHSRLIGIPQNINLSKEVAEVIITNYKNDYPYLNEKKKFIIEEIQKEEDKFEKTLEKGLNKFNRMALDKKISGEEAFLLFQSYGFPLEMIRELANEKKIKVDVKGFEKEFEKHQKLSRKGAKKKFKGGLADSSEETTKLHTATHLLNEALREVLKDEKISQRGSNITPERLRFDFNFDRKLTKEELDKVEDLVNKKISEGLDVVKKEMSLEEAKKIGARGVFEHKYIDKVFVYIIGDFSKEICGGPHVKNIKELGKFKIIKEESISAGVRRIKARLVFNL